jgi:murein DD-endopeptidase MepM/ murein hydrolase activator NlpD
VGAVLLGLLYTTKPDTKVTGITLSRRGDTALVMDTLRRVDTVSSAFAVMTAPEGAIPAERLDTAGAGGPSFPAVSGSDIDALRAHAPVIPVAGVKSQNLIDSFDDLRGTHRHNALDIMAPRGTAVLSADAGKVLKLHNSVAGGLTVYAADPTEHYIYMYGHLDRYRPGLGEGMSVKKGEILGYVGSTGNANPAAPHLHLAITRSDNMKEWWKGTPLNPYLILGGQNR